MFKTEFIDELAKKRNATKKETEAFVEDFFETVRKVAKEDGFVQITGDGTFYFKQTEERPAKNPKTREDIVVPATNIIKFRPGKRMKDI